MSNLNSFEMARAESASQVDIREALVKYSRGQCSAIDRFYERTSALVIRSDEFSSSGSVDMIPLLFLRLISATESYFREVLSGLPYFCPLARKHISSEAIVIGASYHYAACGVGVAAIEHVSFCTKGEINKQTKKMCGFIVDSDRSLKVAVENFEKISQLRHAAVHAYDEVYFNNVRELGLHGDDPPTRYELSISPLVFTKFVSVCYSVVRAYNRSISSYVLNGWIQNQLLKKSWADDKVRFGNLCDLFFSVRDFPSGSTRYRVYRKFLSSLPR